RARFGARQALAHAAAGELERACELAKPILDQVVTIGSATIHADVDKLAAMLRRRNTHPAVRALEPALSIALYSGFRN
ncbi:transcriptional regulator, partial [Kibdelosporangium lantanae]